MAEEKDTHEKSQDPTPKRLKEARDKGQIARSKELNTLLLLLVGSSVMLLTGKNLLLDLMEIMQNSFTLSRDVMLSSDSLLIFFGVAIKKAGIALLPLFLLLTAAALLSPLLLGGWLFNTQSLQPKMERLSIAKGLKRMVSLRAVVDLCKTVAKFSLVLGVGILVVWNRFPEILQLNNEDTTPAILHGMQIVGMVFLIITTSLIVIALFDVPYQIWDNQRKLKMSLQEIKDEMKQTEVRPEVKNRVQKIQREMAQHRMIEAVPTADVVLINPTHYSIAIKYEKEKNGAPIVVAKGAELMALQIRNIAKEHKIEILSSPALARALYYNSELFQEIPEGLYAAVAQVLAYIYQLSRYKRGMGNKPQKMDEVPIPNEFYHE